MKNEKTRRASPGLVGLLKWSLAQQGKGSGDEEGGGGGGGGGKQVRQLSDEERRWFYEAMESQVEDEGERMKQGMLVLASQATDAGNVQRHIDAVEDLEDLVAQIDLAKTFVKLEGMGILLGVATGNSGDNASPPVDAKRLNQLRAGALTTAATCIQHNVEAQNDFLQRGGIELMISLVGKREEDAKVRAKAVSTIAATVRHNARAFMQFLYANGLKHCLLALKDCTSGSGSEAVLPRKSFRLLEYGVRETRAKFGPRRIQQVADCLAEAPALVLASLESSEDMEVRESSLAFLNECCLSSKSFARTELGSDLVSKLRKIAAGIEDGKVDDAYLDEVNLAKDILKTHDGDEN